MNQQQCHRPRERWKYEAPQRGKREKEDYRKWAGHEIILFIEDVLEKKIEICFVIGTMNWTESN